MEDLRLYNSLLCLQFALAIITFAVLLIIVAPYGRHSSPHWGPVLNAKISWFIMEIPAVIMHLIFFVKARSQRTETMTLFFLMFQAHYIQRSIIYPLKMNSSAKPVPMLISGLGALFNILNGYLNGWGIYCSPMSAKYTRDWIATPQFIIGQLVFIAGMTINIHSDSVLRKIRAKYPGEYKIPMEGFHKFVANPNYLGELMEWVGWSIATLSWCGVAFAVYSFANLAPRALKNLKWYRAKFPEYPKNRKAIVPFIL